MLPQTAQISEMPQAVAALAALRADGAWIALDDFGVEYSNLAYLRDLAVDMVKIDRSFLDSAESSARSISDRGFISAWGWYLKKLQT